MNEGEDRQACSHSLNVQSRAPLLWQMVPASVNVVLSCELSAMQNSREPM